MPHRLVLGILIIFLLLPAISYADSASATGENYPGHNKEGHTLPHTEESHFDDLHPLSVVPFVGLLLSIAIFPLVVPHFWHSNLNRGIVAGAFAIPVVFYLLSFGEAGTHALEESLHEYFAFIVLLGSLYTVSGGILLDLKVKPSPLVNVVILAIGAVLANLIGTTGASMLLIRPYLNINKYRTNVSHLPIFFIFVVSNLGGLLTPLGDPPLFLGFLKGVSFFWTLQLYPQWLITNGAVLGIFLLWDCVAYFREPTQSLEKPINSGPATIGIRGLINFLFFLGILGAVLLQAPTVAGPINDFILETIGLEIDLTYNYPQALMILMALLSLWMTPRGLRQANQFGWAAIIEVAVLFIGIFITMVPALEMLKMYQNSFGISEPWHFFWTTGMLSGFLDNAPTYLTFARLGTPAYVPGREIGHWLMNHEDMLLQAISCGAVFFGAMTYIGNGPNFMVKAIAEENEYKTPSFFGYFCYSFLILAPIFVGVTFLFFSPFE